MTAYIREIVPSHWAGIYSGEFDPAAQGFLDYGPRSSVFACSSAEERQLVAVAKRLPTKGDKPFSFVEILESDLIKAEVPWKKTIGKTAVPTANELHFDLDLGESRAQDLVAVLAARNIEIRQFQSSWLRAWARRLNATGAISLAQGHPWLR